MSKNDKLYFIQFERRGKKSFDKSTFPGDTLNMKIKTLLNLPIMLSAYYTIALWILTMIFTLSNILEDFSQLLKASIQLPLVFVFGISVSLLVYSVLLLFRDKFYYLATGLLCIGVFLNLFASNKIYSNSILSSVYFLLTQLKYLDRYGANFTLRWLGIGIALCLFQLVLSLGKRILDSRFRKSADYSKLE